MRKLLSGGSVGILLDALGLCQPLSPFKIALDLLISDLKQSLATTNG